MAILNFVLDLVGQSGQNVKFIYLETSDTVNEVTATGYLNHFVEQNNQVSPTEMALVSTVAAGVKTVNLYNIVHSGANWSLVLIGESPISELVLRNALGDTITLKAPATSFTDVTYTLPPAPGTSGFVLSSTTGGSMSWIANGSGSFNPATSYNGIANPAISGDWLHIGPFNVQAGSGNVILQSDTGSINLLAPNAGQFANVTAANVALAGSAAVTVTGGALTVNMSGSASISSTGALSLSGSSVSLQTLANTSTANVLYYDTTSKVVTYAAAPAAFNPASNYTVTGTWDFTNASIEMPGLANVVTANTVYFNTASGLLTYGAAPAAFDPTANITFTGLDQFNGGFAVAATVGDVSISSTNNSVNILAPTAGKSINLQSPTVSVVASTAFNVTAGSSVYQTSGAGALSIAAGGVLSLQGAGGVNMPSLASATTANVLYWNSSTGFVTQGAAPAGGPTIVNVTGTSQTLAANTRYIINSPGNAVALSLPASIALGAEIDIVWQSATSWTISQQTGQSVRLGAVVTTTSSGTVASTAAGDCITLVCTVADTSFTATSAVGNPDLT